MRIRANLFMIFYILLFCGQGAEVEAREWEILGPRALGMGGASVAVADDATANYWNPAAYGFFKNASGGDYGKRKWSLLIPDAGVGTEVHEGLGEEINKISKYDFKVLSSPPLTPAQVKDFIGLINELKVFNDNPNRSAEVLAHAGIGGEVGHFGIGLNVFSDLSAVPQIDLINISPSSTGSTFTIDDFTNPTNYGCPAPCNTPSGTLSGAQRTELNASLTSLGWNATQTNNFIYAMDYGLTQAGVTATSETITQIETTASVATATANSGGTFSNNTSRLLIKGLAVAEVPFTYGRAITEDFAVGGNLKYMRGRAYHAAPRVFNNKLGDALNGNDYVESSTVGIDLGLLYRFGDKLRAGLTARNINSPSFALKPLPEDGTDSIAEQMQVRAGLLYKPLSFLRLAADIDLTRNNTNITGNYKSQNVGGGLELSLFKFLLLRGGAYTNLAQSDIGLVYTAGLGINLWLLQLDIGAAMAKNTTQIDTQSVPVESKVDFSLSMLF
ncbi:MAG: conjugal transfer protein TraF [Nitrospirae bacterium]|nr:conjugal transfer protein TraF [Nitrospirota bacterium]MBI3352472.1 conjugal transfer protein TraF [Nitrospirota bacterium]